MSRQSTPSNPLIIGYLAILAIATIAAYSDIYAHEVLRWDDKIYLNSELVKSLSPENLLSIFSARHHGNWHPLSTLSFAIEHALWGSNAFYSKLTNLFLHLLNVLLFYLLSVHLLLLATSRQTLAKRPGIVNLLLQDRNKFAVYSSLFAATLFALHPQHVESVVWISERKGLLCAVFYLASLITYIKAAGEQKQFFTRLTLIFMLCALMSKPMAISLPVAFVLLDIYPLRKIEKFDFSAVTIKTLLADKVIYILLTIASIVITLLYQEPQGSAVLGYLPRLINAFAAYLHYLTSLFYPGNLSPFYPFQEISLNPSIYSVFPALVFLCLVVVALALYLKKVHFPLVIITFYVISLLPVIGIVKVGYQAMADRYAYLPTIWFFLLAGVAIFALFAWLQRSRLQFIGAIFLAAISLSLGLTTFENSRHWQNDSQLWGRVIDVFPDSAAFAYVNLAATHEVKGDMEMEQIGQLIDKALSISPDEPYILQAAANYHGMLGDEQTALEHLLRIINVAPYNIWAQTTAGDIYFARNDIANAGNHYLAAIQHGSDSIELVYKLALIDFRFKRYADALSKLEIIAPADMGEKERLLYKNIQQALARSSQ